ncbi:MAG: hypothetical protein HYX63_01610 [Gammaproteobacteria bacterium]|nr:hypothetical protein [Gammaproteobacteria bacterium]
MIRPECIQAVAQALGRAPSQVELRDMENTLSSNLRRLAREDPQRVRAMTPGQRLNAAAKLTAEDLVAAVAKKKQRIALTIQANDRVSTYLENHPSNTLEALDELVAFKANTKGSVLSLETRAKAIMKDAERRLNDLWAAGGDKWFGLWQNKEGMAALIREIHGESTGDALSAKAAKAWHEVTEELRTRYNEAGGVIGKLDDWGMPHHHSPEKVGQAGVEQWITDTLPKLDRERYVNEDGTRMTDEQVHKFLSESWLSIASRGANKIEPGQLTGPGMKANRHAEERQIHFANADAYIAYQKQYGDRALYNVMIHHLHSLSRDLAATETLGPNPDFMFKKFLDTGVKETATSKPLESEKVASRAQSIETLYNYVTGKSQPIANRTIARWSDNLRNLLTASRLGSAIISSFSDEGTMHLTAAVNGLSHIQLLRNSLVAMNPLDRTELRMARRTGLALDTVIGTLNRYGEDQLSGWTSRVANVSLRVSGLNAITEARQRAFGITMMDALGSMTREHSWAEIEAGDAKVLKSKGLTETDWNIFKQAELEAFGHGNDGVLTPDSVAAIADEKIAKTIGNEDPKAISRVRREAMLKLIGAVQEETTMAVIEPGARDRLALQFGSQRGTAKGEFLRSIFQFKSFPFAMLERSLGRANMLGGSGRVAYLASLIASTTILGALSVQVNEMVSGRDPQNMKPNAKNDWKFWVKSLLKGGALGLYGDFLFSDSSQHGGSLTSSLLGPTVGLAEEALNLTQGNLVQSAQGKDTHWQAEAVKFFKGITPGTSLWYAKAALDHLIFQKLQEHWSPGYLAKIKSRARTEFKQDYWWDPGKSIPKRAPNLGRSYQ